METEQPGAPPTEQMDEQPDERPAQNKGFADATTPRGSGDTSPPVPPLENWLRNQGTILVQAADSLAQREQQSRQLQSRLLKAEEALGTARAELSELTGQYQELTDAHQRTMGDLAHLTESHARVNLNLTALRSENEKLLASVTRFDARMNEAETARQGLQTRYDAAQEQVRELEQTARAVEQTKRRLEGEIAAAQELLGTSADVIEKLQERVGALERRERTLSSQLGTAQGELSRCRKSLREQAAAAEQQKRAAAERAAVDRQEIERLNGAAADLQQEKGRIENELRQRSAEAARHVPFEQLWDGIGLRGRMECARVFLDRTHPYVRQLETVSNMLQSCENRDGLRANARTAQIFQPSVTNCLPPPEPGQDGPPAERIAWELLNEAWHRLVELARNAGVAIIAPAHGEPYNEQWHTSRESHPVTARTRVARCEQIGFVLDGEVQRKATVALTDTPPEEVNGRGETEEVRQDNAAADNGDARPPDWLLRLTIAANSWRGDAGLAGIMDALNSLHRASLSSLTDTEPIDTEALRKPLSLVAPLMTIGYDESAAPGLPSLSTPKEWRGEFSKVRHELDAWLNQRLQVFTYRPAGRDRLDVELGDPTAPIDPTNRLVSRTVLAGFYRKLDEQRMVVCKAKVEMLPLS